MTIIEQIRDELVNPLTAALDRLSDAITNNSLLALPGGTRGAAIPEPKRGRPAKIVSPDQLNDPPSLPPTAELMSTVVQQKAGPPVDYDKVLTDARTIAAELLQKDQQAKNSAYKDQLVALWRELHPTGNGKLSGLPQDKLPAALERLKQIAA